MENVEANGNKGHAVLIFLTGLGAGIALTALLASDSGPATRRLVGRKTGRPKNCEEAAETVVPD